MGVFVNRLRTKLIAGALLAILIGLNAWSLLSLI
jgi:hypothetical protein